jgi:hypothetical protein
MKQLLWNEFFPMDQLLQYPSCLQLLEQVEYVAEAFIVLLPHQTLQVQHTSSY